MKLNYDKCLNEYNHSRPIINSHLENQYHKEFFYDDLGQYGIMFTTFNFHFSFGKIPTYTTKLKKVIQKYIDDNNKEIFILYAPNIEWEKVLNKLFKELDGKVKQRSSYTLNIEKFKEYDTHNSFVKLESRKENSSLIEYPQANTYIKGKLISYCRGFMIGENKVELDVWTEKSHRLQGLAFDGCLCLIEHLINEKLDPVWTCWEYKEPSKNLAEKLGFELKETYNAYIWKKEKR